jgi:predicted DCC family thiol-disulfide oxidoreductase YuxK
MTTTRLLCVSAVFTIVPGLLKFEYTTLLQKSTPLKLLQTTAILYCSTSRISTITMLRNSKRVSSLFLIALRPSASFTTTLQPTTQARLMMSTSLFPEAVNVIYDSKCNLCKLEIDWLSRRDERLNAPQRKLKLTDLESDDYDPNDPANGMVGYRQGMEAIHAVTPDGKVLKGVPVFSIAYEQVGLGWLFAVTQWPILSPIVKFGYDVFAKYRTYITRGSSVDDLVRIYEERQNLSKAQQTILEDEDCEVCKTSAGLKST